MNGTKALAFTAICVAMGSGLSACGGGGGGGSNGFIAPGITLDPAPAPAPAPAPVPAPAPAPDTRVPIQSVTVFGDSLSDVGTYKVATGDAANPGKFTVNPGKVWVEGIADFYGFALSPNRSLTLDKNASGVATAGVGTATVLGGNGYAEGGARVDAFPSQSSVGNNQLVAPVTQQITRYLASHARFPASELVVIDGGGNDTYAQFSSVCWGTDDNGPGTGGGTATLAGATAQVASAAYAQVANIKRIHDNGAPVVLVAAALDWSGNPFGQYYLSDAYQSAGCYTKVPASQVSTWTIQFNQILQSGIAGMPNVVYMDAGPDFADAVAHPAKYGLLNTTAPACTNTAPNNSAAFCTAATLAAPDAAQTWLWSDAFHPTPRGHQILSDAALQLLKATTKKAP
ncbi:phospholipase/lecithinase/hemolysin [Variovorax boronicumulans]|uniref:Phospholipase/lecithinase/hemolysin n=1 Tax=Variovorax boronicumulans TaxID=436515 RepID=A0AAW8DXA5_9BURK|nr:SGNH/GDSL hydrolase family protein [Variovorax boronicumulans]MDP9878924.1 phospholipase/lecithinase/hemolysin [Variovorax boronicumulans]MDP9924208.1 phospholipase/lecithinase/hemolysin [Variovorax boronicumulans]